MIAALAMSTFAVAGGDIAPVEPEVTLPEVVEESTGAFYVGIAYGLLNQDGTETVTGISDDPLVYSFDEDANSVMLQAGYKFNPYIAVEGRYWIDVDSDWDGDVWGVYVKPMYPVTNAFDIYALLGYASIDSDMPVDTDGFSWGIGGAYAFTENLSVFVDYTSIYDDDFSYDVENVNLNVDSEVTAWNFGFTYTF